MQTVRITADAMATVIIVLGPNDGFDFAVRHELAVLILVADGDCFIEKATPAFQREFEN